MRRGSLYVTAFVAASHFLQAADPLVLSEPFSRDGMINVTVSNEYSRPVTGLLVQATIVENGKRRAIVSHYLDIYVNAFHDKAITPGEKRQIPIIDARLPPTAVPSIVIAGAVFEDGSRLGSDYGVRVLLGRRTELQNAISRFRDHLTSLRGTDLSSVVAATTSLAQEQQVRARGLPPEEGPILAAATLVSDWIKRALDGAPQGCGPDCVTKRIDYILGGLSVWNTQVQAGIDQAAR